MATCQLDRRNQMLLTSQPPGETTSKLMLIQQYQDWTPKEYSKMLVKQTDLLVVAVPGGLFIILFGFLFCIINFTIIIF
jgi:hypothetical protein